MTAGGRCGKVLVERHWFGGLKGWEAVAGQSRGNGGMDEVERSCSK